MLMYMFLINEKCKNNGCAPTLLNINTLELLQLGKLSIFKISKVFEAITLVYSYKASLNATANLTFQQKCLCYIM